MIAVIDNYDSFTFNLVQLFLTLNRKVTVHRNDAVSVDNLAASSLSALVVSPGPGRPEDAGVSVEAVRQLPPTTPILGVCLGHQAIAAACGGTIRQAHRIMHGKTSAIHHDGLGVFKGLPNPFEAVRYHSLVVDPERLPDCLRVSAWTAQGEIMGIRHCRRPVEGVQFHPESILSGNGPDLIHNFISSLSEGGTEP